MTDAAPPLADGETLLHTHVPSLRSFQRTALVFLGLALLVTAIAAGIGAPDYVVIAPVILTLLVLLQERLTLGRNGAWVTNRRILFQTGREVPLSRIGPARPRGTSVRLGGEGGRIMYAADAATLARTINEATSS